MAILSWGKPKLEIVVTTDGAVPATPTWVELPVIKEGTAKLNTTEGTKTEALGEGGEVIDVRTQKNKYAFECEIFVKKNDSRPISDEDGLITTNYCLRLTPEDDTLEGWIMENTSVTVLESWSSADGKILKYTFTGLKPKTGNILKPYTKQA
jgi:hypothetical protein